ncbi:MAG: ribonuclease P protein component, partial [Candidatus Cloacimonetes bacterium]|nr:ribonuclease P protein component [Candidatus Cloacimonadota bacterium]
TVVRRNRVKRRLREILRRDVLPRLDEAGLALDVLVRARREAYDARFAELREELVRWTDRRLSRAASSS